MATIHNPNAGRFLVRYPVEGAAIVGIAFFPQSFRIVEGAAYLMSLRDGHMGVYDQPLDDGIPAEHVAAGASNLLTSHVWYRTGHTLMTTVRFLEAFPEENGWVVVSASDVALPLGQQDEAGHAWFDLGGAGELHQVAAPAEARGAAMGQMLTQFPVWPGPGGHCYSLPQIESTWRADFLRNAKLCAQVGRGELDIPGYRAQVRSDKRLLWLVAFDPDREYCRYLAALEAAGGLELDGPRTAQAHEDRERMSQRVLATAFELAA